MPPIQDRPLGNGASVALVDYDTPLTRAVESLPNSSQSARAELYERIRAALIARLKSEKQPRSIEAELRVLEEAIARLEARIMQNAQDDTAIAPILLPSPAKSEPVKSSGRFQNSLARSSRNAREQPSRSPALSKSVGVVSTEARQRIRQASSVIMPPIDKPSEDQEVAPAFPSLSGAEEKPMSRSDEFNRALRKLQNDSPGVEACAIISEDGLMIASVLSPEMEESRVAGMTATLLSLGSRAAIELMRGSVREVIVRGEQGYAVLLNTGRGALLLTLTDESAKLGLIFFDMREAVRAIAKVL